MLCDFAFGQACVAALINLSIASGSSASLLGHLNLELGLLTTLVQLSLAPGMISSSIPTTLSRLTCLWNLGPSHNLFTGIVSAFLATLPRLATLDLSFNRLSRCIPSGFQPGCCCHEVRVNFEFLWAHRYICFRIFVRLRAPDQWHQLPGVDEWRKRRRLRTLN
ncbi:hypothetical protein GOP47_0017320 [Adiantum capillus-veneris]|uniref:Uncharacterized protein n=1 Tax=Adiantum capillus-veneris TaxID=13818 RepID=A0A9D4UFM2_ADICA|nr:hypothetical protein GOP47_0017320 [Adiantum capillus-veneris]